jgi:hypothetical protein
MKDAQQPSIGFTRREAMQIGLGTIFNTAVAAAGALAAEAAERGLGCLDGLPEFSMFATC